MMTPAEKKKLADLCAASLLAGNFEMVGECVALMSIYGKEKEEKMDEYARKAAAAILDKIPAVPQSVVL